MDPDAGYYWVVNQPDQAKDHFIELQFIANYIRVLFPNWRNWTLEAFYPFVSDSERNDFLLL